MNLHKKLSPLERASIFTRPSQHLIKKEQIVKEVFQNVLLYKEEAIKKYTKQFDKIIVEDIVVNKKEIESAIKNTPHELKKAIAIAYKNIHKFHLTQIEKKIKIETTKGIECWRESRAIERIGIYIPGGTAPLFSSVLMLGIPAIIAGCKEIAITTPPNKFGKIDNTILYTAAYLGIKKIFKVGGIQAIAALTFGTKNISSVNKIVGPGNSFVTAAKMEAIKFGVAIDMPAGPSELMIITDEFANTNWVAADILAQLEHGPDSQVICIVKNEKIADNILNNIQNQIEQLKRQDIIRESLKNSHLIIENNFQTQVNYANEYASEHLILNCKNYRKYIPQIINAGSVFLGAYSAEALGDYASGTNHTLPTNRFATAYSGVSVDTFIKKITFQHVTQQGLKNLGRHVVIMANQEQLDAHASSISIRMGKGDN